MKRSVSGYFVILLGLVLCLSGCGPKTKSEAIQIWKAKDKPEKIVKLIYDPQQAIRLEAIEALVELQAQEAVGPLASLFTDPDKIVVHEAIDAVVEIGGSEIEPYMLQAIALDTIPARLTAATALGELKSAAAVDSLIRALNDYKYEELVLAAIKSLGQIGDPKAVEPLSKKLQERSYAVREACIVSLRQIGGEAAIKGIATRLGDVNESIRHAAVDALKEGGAVSAPFALESLRSESPLTRASAVSVLRGIDAVPEAGNDLVWYRLSELTMEEGAVVDPVKADVFASIEDPVPGLLEAVVYTAADVREYAFVALENAGEGAVEPAMMLAKQKATKAGLAWFEQRSEWSGAPSWRLDLWAALTVLNPKFQINPTYVDLLKEGGRKAEKVMSSEQFRVQREIIPFLLFQFKSPNSTDEDRLEQAERCRSLAAEHLSRAGYPGVYPLMASLYDADLEIATGSGYVLNTMRSSRVDRFVVDECMKQFATGEDIQSGEGSASEQEPVAAKRNPGEELSGTSLHHALLELDIPELEPFLLKIRPTAEEAIWAFQQKHPGVKVINLPLSVKVDPALKAVPFLLSYYKNGQMNELKVVYRQNRTGEWAIQPPLPDELL